jgi:hypothetical protein
MELALLAGAVVCLDGCHWLLDPELNPEFCRAHPSDEECRKTFPDADTGCSTNAQCAAPVGVCALPERTCVQCTATDHAVCTGLTPACGIDDKCRACAAHAECSSNACLPDGSCGTDTTVAYVDPAGTGTTCTQQAPCKLVADALKTGRQFVKFQGVTNEQVSLNNTDVTFLADPGAALTDTSNGILLKIDGTSHVTIYDLTIRDASGMTNPGISLQPGNTANLSLIRATVSGNIGGGIAASGGTLTVSRSTIASNPGGGIVMTGLGTLFTITNNFIYRNGNNATASAGGLSLIPTGASSLEFNTIVDNQAKVSSTSAGGVFCDQMGFTAAHNIIFRNTGGTSGNVQTVGVCTYGDSFIMPGASIVDNAPGFAHPNESPFDYHLTAASPKTIVDAAGPCTGVDFDGDTRPIGPACDLGADEWKP